MACNLFSSAPFTITVLLSQLHIMPTLLAPLHVLNHYLGSVYTACMDDRERNSLSSVVSIGKLLYFRPLFQIRHAIIVFTYDLELF